jgi:hypothetical protein
VLRGSDSVDTLGQEVTEGMSDIGGVPLGLSGSQACSAANLPVDPTQQAVLRAYPNNPAARKAIRAQAKCSKAR